LIALEKFFKKNENFAISKWNKNCSYAYKQRIYRNAYGRAGDLFIALLINNNGKGLNVSPLLFKKRG
jgi:hypothetical protein